MKRLLFQNAEARAAIWKYFFNPALHAAAAASEAEEKETKMRALAPSPGTLTVVVFYV